MRGWSNENLCSITLGVLCCTGAGYSKVCLASGTFFSTSLIWIRIQRKPYGENFTHTQIKIFSPLCFHNEIRTVVKLTNHEQRNNEKFVCSSKQKSPVIHNYFIARGKITYRHQIMKRFLSKYRF